MTESGSNPRAGEPRWGVVLLAREPSALILAHLAWHLQAGASAIQLYLDDPADPVAETLAGVPKVQVIRCDSAFWQTLGGRPVLQTRRQSLIATQAYQQTRLDWLLHLDADEFLFSPQPFATQLATLTPDAAYLALPNVERVFGTHSPRHIFEGTFLSATRPGQSAAPGSAAASAFLQRGLAGHSAGKACVPRGHPWTLQPHAPRAAGGKPPARHLSETRILHFDGLTPLHWLIKLRRYAAHPPAQWERFLGPHRRAQLQFVRDNNHDPAALRAFHDQLKTGQGATLDFDPGPALSRFIHPAPDLTVAAFDAALRLAEPQLSQGL